MGLRRYTWRSMQQRPGRTVLTMLSIVIGVTAAVSVGLGTAVTRNAYKQMFSMMTGRATLEISALGGGTIPDALLADVERVEGVVAATPLIERPQSMSFDDRRVRLQVLGIDPLRDPQVRDYRIVAGRSVQEGDEVVLERGFADFLGLAVGDEVRMLTQISIRPRPFTIVGLLEPQSGAAFTQVAMALVPIDRAQAYFNSRYVPKGSIDRIQLVTTREEEDIESVQGSIAKLLPEGAQVHRPAASTQLMQETLRSSEQGLWLTTLLTLLMAVFIVLNTFFMNVAERRRHLSILRAIGATKGQVAGSLIGEALVLGVLGTAIGMLAGVGVAFVVTYTLAVAFSVELPRLVEVMTLQPFVVGAIFGLSMAVVGAILPAILAGRVSPLEGMNRQVNVPTRRLTALFLVGGVVLTGGALYVIIGSIRGTLSIAAAQYAAWPLLIGMVMLNSVLLGPQSWLVAGLLRRFAPVETGLAIKQVMRHHTRSALTVAVLFIVASTVIGMGNSIRDNVKDVDEWYNQAIVGDYFIRAMMPDMATGTAADLPEGIGDDLEQVPHLKPIDAAAFVEAKVHPPGAGAEPLTVIVLCREFVEGNPSFDVIEGDPAQLGEQLRDGQVVLASVLAQKLGVTVGDTLPLETTAGIKPIPIAAIVNDYMVGGMGVHMHRSYAERWLSVTGVDGYVIKVEDERYLEEVRAPLAAIAKKYDVMLMSHGDIRQTVDRIVGGVEWSLWALVFLGFVVAAFGVVNTLTMNVLEQTRELGLLRIVAMTKRQVRRTIVMQALIIAGVGLPPGILMGLGIAYVLNLAMMPSFGRPIDFHFYPDLLVGTFVGAVIIVLIAAIIPARRAERLNVVEALHYE